MSTDILIPNGLKEERLAAGIETAGELAARADIDPQWYEHLEQGRALPTAAELGRLVAVLGDVPADRLYSIIYRQLIPGQQNNAAGYSPASMYRGSADTSHMLLARDEITWFDRQPGPNHRADVFMNLACATQRIPHLLLDTIAVLERLDVNFVAVAGAPACCGKPFFSIERPDTAEQVNKARIDRSQAWGASTHVNWCTACQATSTVAAGRRSLIDGVEHPVREVQVLTFLEERLRELGDKVPWKKSVSRHVLVEGHPQFGAILRDAWEAAARLLTLIPGVQVVDLYDGHSDQSPCTGRAREPGWTPPAWYQNQDNAQGVREHRARLADYAESRGADTVSCQHQTCHAIWSRYASDRLAVRHAVSILAEALDCAHPDRYQAAVRLGDPERFLAQTRQVWESWGITEAKARELSATISDPTYASATEHACGGHAACSHRLHTVDVLTGATRPA